MQNRDYIARYSDGQGRASEDVRVRLTDRGVTILSRDTDVPRVWPYGALASAEPLSDHAIDALLSYSYQPGASLFVADRTFARDLATLAPHLSVRAQRWRRARPLIWAMAIAGGFVLLSWVTHFSPSRAIAGLLPDSARSALGAQVLASMTDGRRVCDAKGGRAALDALTEKLTVAAGGATKFKVIVVDWDLLNAFATPGEQIVLTRGLIAKAKSPDEVAGVLAHEMGHGLELHPETGIVRTLGLVAGTELLLGGAGGSIANIGLLLAQLSYSREAEREADEQALRLLRGAAISPQGLLDFFDRILEIENKDGTSSGPAVLKSHPQTEERKERVAQAESYAAEPSLDSHAWAELQAICGEAGPPARRSGPPLGPDDI